MPSEKNQKGFTSRQFLFQALPLPKTGEEEELRQQ